MSAEGCPGHVTKHFMKMAIGLRIQDRKVLRRKLFEVEEIANGTASAGALLESRQKPVDTSNNAGSVE